MRFFLVVALLLCSPIGLSAQAITIGTENSGPFVKGWMGDVPDGIVQAFTAERSYLHSFSFWVHAGTTNQDGWASPLTVAVMKGIGYFSSPSEALFTVKPDPTYSGRFDVYLDNFSLDVGETYSLIFSVTMCRIAGCGGEPSGGPSWRPAAIDLTTEDVFEGELYRDIIDRDWRPRGPFDYDVRFSMVQSNDVSAPASASLLLAGLLGIARAARRRRLTA